MPSDVMVSGPQQRKPSVGRDSTWLVGADLFAVALAFLGQIILARMLLPEQYGWMVIAIDVYASFFLVVDLGLPTLLARDGAQAPDLVPRAVHRTRNAPRPHACCFADGGRSCGLIRPTIRP